MIIHYLDPAGNTTAIVEDGLDIPAAKRLEISRDIMDKGLAEQVAFEVAPGRIEMMGGEFCGNASRAYGYLKALDCWSTGEHEVLINISGASGPVLVKVNLDAGEAYAAMPSPLEIVQLAVGDVTYPVVRMEGIDHMIIHSEADEMLAAAAIEAMLEQLGQDACGVMFLSDNKLVPVVHVRETNSTIWESSCGSGSVATAWYLASGSTGEFELVQPGGTIKVIIDDGQIMMGGKVSIME
ncbi:MAG: hypothetical protein KBS68_01560 [Clostridiales bacterium]|nr:hypothetical protein [Candidatus Crickella merdequi]